MVGVFFTTDSTLWRGVWKGFMSTTKELWQQLVQHGQLCHRSVSEWHALAGSRREQLFREAQATPPLTYSPVSLENKNLLRSYHAQGLLPEFHPEDFADLNSDEADFLIRCAEENRWLTADSLSDHYCRTARDTAPASSEQLASIIKLGRDGHLRRFSSKTLLKLCRLSAERLIWRGEMNRRSAADVSD